MTTEHTTHQSSFLKVFLDADEHIQDESVEDPFPAYLDGIDTTLAPFCPTSANRVLKALRMAQVGPNDIVVDLGSGDGRFVTAAVAEFNASRAVGIESDSDLVETSKRLANQVLLASNNKTQFILGDLLDLPTLVHDTDWTVMIVFLLPDHTDKFADLLLHHYRKGARIISLVFNLNEIPELKLIASNVPEGIFVYGSAATKSSSSRELAIQTR
ncbi:hypothetical protein MBANPS3_009080 [Mucor bainieri]